MNCDDRRCLVFLVLGVSRLRVLVACELNLCIDKNVCIVLSMWVEVGGVWHFCRGLVAPCHECSFCISEALILSSLQKSSSISSIFYLFFGSATFWAFLQVTLWMLFSLECASC